MYYGVYVWQNHQHLTVQDVEKFRNLEHAKGVLWERDGDSFYPCNDGHAFILLTVTDPRPEGAKDSVPLDMLADRIVEFGPRKGIKVTEV